ncbi:putative 3-methyladenine DNA glycosylase [Tenacibaculum sp. KUL152]|nr:putative 3-methyladenine DNA glycosylase [Tenacibaculum sp. KUL152]
MKRTFFTDSNVVTIAKSLIGKFLFSKIEAELTGGMIVETEAYCGDSDLAMQTHLLRRPSSIKMLKSQGGSAYIYTVYGRHSMFNIVTNQTGFADSVLIRAIKPAAGLNTMIKRRGLGTPSHNLCSGPAKMSQALAITPAFNGVSVLDKSAIWVEDKGLYIASEDILCSPRIGIDYAQNDRNLPWRFRLRQDSKGHRVRSCCIGDTKQKAQ